jgi:type VI secretion system ImpM family protein
VSSFVSGKPGFIGKLPERAEYLPVPTSAPAFADFDSWLSACMEWAAARSGPTFLQAFAGGVMHGCLFRNASSPGQLLAGAITPSRDQAGRKFPLALMVPLSLSEAAGAQTQLLPFLFEDLWGLCAETLSRRLAGDEAGWAASFVELESLPAPGLSQASQLYTSWAASLPQDELWELLHGPNDERAALRFLIETIAPLRGAERASTALSVRVPLGELGGVALCFWLDLMRRHLGWRSWAPSLFWSQQDGDGSALIHLGTPPPSALAELWQPTGERDEIADLTLPFPQGLEQHLAPLSPKLQAALIADARVDAILAAVD